MECCQLQESEKCVHIWTDGAVTWTDGAVIWTDGAVTWTDCEVIWTNGCCYLD